MRKFFIPLMFVGLLAIMFVSVLELPAIGDPNNPSQNEVGEYYIENAIDDTKTPNTVTAVLKYYRGIDTLLEAGVLFTSIVAVISVLRGNEIKKSIKEE
jgi:multisubunit Na+/H+ antiporter MnhB subunit